MQLQKLNPQTHIAIASTVAILLSLILRYATHSSPFIYNAPLLLVIIFGGAFLIRSLLNSILKKQFGADLLAGISILTALILGEYLAATLVVLMLSGGEALENYAVHRASDVLHALAKRMPTIAHKKIGDRFEDISTESIQIGDIIVVFPHELCPVDGEVVEGHGAMDESFLTGEPFRVSKTPGSTVISGAVNGEAAITLKASKLAKDSRYAKIMQVVKETEVNRPPLRRLGDSLGAFYTPFALIVAAIAWAYSGDPLRFLSVLVIATPCPLLIAIPVAIIGAISLSAKRGIIIKNPAILEQLHRCKTIIFDKTGTLTYGKPVVTEIITAENITEQELLLYAASLEQYSKHPLAQAIIDRAREKNVILAHAGMVSEKPGQGLTGTINQKQITITSRKLLAKSNHPVQSFLPKASEGLECIVMVDNKFGALIKMHDAPRSDSKSFIKHLGDTHHFTSVMLVSGDRESEVKYFAEQVGISDIHFNKSPEEKVTIVKTASEKNKTVYIGDGINDAPALIAATVGIAFGQHSEITSESADAVIMETTLRKVDELFHISSRMYRIALESAIGGMALSVVGMFFALTGALTPVAAALGQELIDLLSVLNALRIAFPAASSKLTDYGIRSTPH